MMYVFFRALFRMMFTIFYRWRIKGADHVPQEGSVLICSNHISNFDPPLVGGSIKRKIHFMAKEELFRNRLIGFFLKKVNAFPVKRNGGGSAALKTAMRLLKANQVVGIFPEGNRVKTNESGKAHVGAALLAIKTQTPIVPVAIVGPYRLFRPLPVLIGEPIDPSEYHDTKQAQELTDRLMKEIQRLKNSVHA